MRSKFLQTLEAMGPRWPPSETTPTHLLQASRGPVDPKASSVGQALMASLGPVVCQGRPAPLETRVFLEKLWAPILGPGEMLAYPATLA